jgi:putative hydrolase of the HAD superfamily
MSNDHITEAIIFDLDDTILAYGVAGDVWQSICLENARLIDGVDEYTLLDALNKARETYWADPERHRRGRLNLLKARRELVELAFSNLGIDNLDIAHKIADTYSTIREERAKLFPGSIETLEHLKASGKRMALITNGASDMQRAKIERYRLAQYFDNILIEGEFGAGKPDKSVFVHTLTVLGISPEEAWMVGDDLDRDIAGAQSVGIYTVWVDWKNEGLPKSTQVIPDKTVTSISELKNGEYHG